MTDIERQRLAHILGMLGSDHAGERAAAALQAEAFRKKHGLEWAEMINGKTVYVGGQPPWAKTADELMRQATIRIAELEAELERRPTTIYMDRVVEKTIYVDRVIYRWPLLWRLRPVAGGWMDRGIAIVLGVIPIIIVLTPYVRLLRQRLGY